LYICRLLPDTCHALPFLLNNVWHFFAGCAADAAFRAEQLKVAITGWLREDQKDWAKKILRKYRIQENIAANKISAKKKYRRHQNIAFDKMSLQTK
jgi:antirestriction protein